MRRSSKRALALWVLLAAVVFNVRFDWQTRQAGFRFVESQMAHRAAGRPLATIETGFRPLVGEAAIGAGLWMLVVLATGAAGITFASKAR